MGERTDPQAVIDAYLDAATNMTPTQQAQLRGFHDAREGRPYANPWPEDTALGKAYKASYDRSKTDTEAAYARMEAEGYQRWEREVTRQAELKEQRDTPA